MSTVNIHGHDIDVYQPDPGQIVTDVIVLCRTLRPDTETGEALWISNSPGITYMLQLGMLNAATDRIRFNQED